VLAEVLLLLAEVLMLEVKLLVEVSQPLAEVKALEVKVLVLAQ
jgi:hypothetical protein